MHRATKDREFKSRPAIGEAREKEREEVTVTLRKTQREQTIKKRRYAGTGAPIASAVEKPLDRESKEEKKFPDIFGVHGASSTFGGDDDEKEHMIELREAEMIVTTVKMFAKQCKDLCEVHSPFELKDAIVNVRKSLSINDQKAVDKMIAVALQYGVHSTCARLIREMGSGTVVGLDKEDANELIYELLWILTNLCSSPGELGTQQCLEVLKTDIIVSLIAMLNADSDSISPEIIEQIFWFTANFAGDATVCCNFIFESGSSMNLAEALYARIVRIIGLTPDPSVLASPTMTPIGAIGAVTLPVEEGRVRMMNHFNLIRNITFCIKNILHRETKREGEWKSRKIMILKNLDTLKKFIPVMTWLINVPSNNDPELDIKSNAFSALRIMGMMDEFLPAMLNPSCGLLNSCFVHLTDKRYFFLWLSALEVIMNLLSGSNDLGDLVITTPGFDDVLKFVLTNIYTVCKTNRREAVDQMKRSDTKLESYRDNLHSQWYSILSNVFAGSPNHKKWAVERGYLEQLINDPKGAKNVLDERSKCLDAYFFEITKRTTREEMDLRPAFFSDAIKAGAIKSLVTLLGNSPVVSNRYAEVLEIIDRIMDWNSSPSITEKFEEAGLLEILRDVSDTDNEQINDLVIRIIDRFEQDEEDIFDASIATDTSGAAKDFITKPVFDSATALLGSHLFGTSSSSSSSSSSSWFSPLTAGSTSIGATFGSTPAKVDAPFAF
jgi:hypothetical protein